MPLDQTPEERRAEAQKLLDAAIKDKVNSAKKAKTKGLPKFTAIINLLQSSPEWEGVLSYDEFSLRIRLYLPIPGFARLDDVFPRDFREFPDLLDATHWIQSIGKLDAGKDVVWDAIMHVSYNNAHHPVRDYLRNLRWDGRPRLETWMHEHLGAENTLFNKAAGAKWLIGGVARIMEPGCFVKNILTLESNQDFGKSTALSILSVKSEWFLDHIADLSSKDALIQTAGKWIVEFAEFDSLGRSASSRVKAFLSTRIDTYRPPYGKTASDFPRQWIGAATINKGGNGYLVDETGNVRFWPVECAVGWKTSRKVDKGILYKARDQLWAEAFCRYNQKETWWLDTEELREKQTEISDERVQVDSRETKVRAFLTEKVNWTTLGAVMEFCGIPTENQDRARQILFGTLMHQIKWKRYRWIAGPDGPGYYYFPPKCGDRREYAARMNDLIRNTREKTRFTGEDEIPL